MPDNLPPIEDFDPITYAEEASRHLTPEQVHGMRAFLVGVFSSYVDPDAPPLQMTPARWRRYVDAAVTDAQR